MKFSAEKQIAGPLNCLKEMVAAIEEAQSGETKPRGF